MSPTSSSSSIAFLFLSAASALTLSACGNSPPETGADAHPAHGAADAAPADAQPSDGFVSNTPGATVVGNTNPDVTLISSNLVQAPSGSEYYQQWLGEIRNHSASPQCDTKIDISFANAAGTQLTKFTAYAYAAPYMEPASTVTTSCIPPGEVGTFWTNGFAPGAIAIDSVATISITLTPNVFSNVVPAPHAPTVTSTVTTVFSTYYALMGTMTGNVAAIYNIGVAFFPRDPSGLVLAHLTATDLDTLQPGGSFAFTSSSYEQPFTQYRQFVEFIDGAKSAAAQAPAPLIAGLEAARRQDHAEALAREQLAAAAR